MLECKKTCPWHGKQQNSSLLSSFDNNHGRLTLLFSLIFFFLSFSYSGATSSRAIKANYLSPSNFIQPTKNTILSIQSQVRAHQYSCLYLLHTQRSRSPTTYPYTTPIHLRHPLPHFIPHNKHIIQNEHWSSTSRPRSRILHHRLQHVHPNAHPTTRRIYTGPSTTLGSPTDHRSLAHSYSSLDLFENCRPC